MISDQIQKIEVHSFSCNGREDYEARVFYNDAIIMAVHEVLMTFPAWRADSLGDGITTFFYYVQSFLFPNAGRTLGTINFEMFKDTDTDKMFWVADDWRPPTKQDKNPSRRAKPMGKKKSQWMQLSDLRSGALFKTFKGQLGFYGGGKAYSLTSGSLMDMPKELVVKEIRKIPKTIKRKKLKKETVE